MKIYTKKGDDGTTGLLGGSRVPKDHLRIEAYGTVDELNSYLGLLRDLSPEGPHKAVLLRMQHLLFTIGSHLAVEPGYEGKIPLPRIGAEDVQQLEDEMDRMDAELPPMRHFVLPGGHPVVAHSHVARCICRRAERCVTALSHHEAVEAILIAYLNRSSDYLFVLSRSLAASLGAEEHPWVPEKGRTD